MMRCLTTTHAQGILTLALFGVNLPFIPKRKAIALMIVGRSLFVIEERLQDRGQRVEGIYIKQIHLKP
jgi:hypothetical protein